jgi:hypothetical protein
MIAVYIVFKISKFEGKPMLPATTSLFGKLIRSRVSRPKWAEAMIASGLE